MDERIVTMRVGPILHEKLVGTDVVMIDRQPTTFPITDSYSGIRNSYYSPPKKRGTNLTPPKKKRKKHHHHKH